MTQNNNLLNQTWETLSNALTRIFEFQPMSQEEYMTLYNNVSRYLNSPEYDDNFLHDKRERERDALDRLKVTNNTDTTDNDQEDVNIPGGALYFRIKNFFKDHLEKIATNENNSQGEDFLRFYAKTWERYQFSSQIANGIAIMVNNWVRRQKIDNVKGIYDIYTVAMYIWQDIFFKEPTQSLTQTCLNLINQERNGAKITSMLIRQVVQSYASAGFIRSGRNDVDNRSLSTSLATYVNYFEKQFLQETEQFYRLESTNFIENNSIIAYMKKVTQRIHEEENRAKDILHPTTMEKLKPMLDRVLIVDQLDRMQNEAKQLLRDEKIDDLRILFDLVNRIDKANEPIQKDLEEYSYECGMSAIARISERANKEPKVYVEAIIEVYEKFSKIVKGGFASQHGYIVALDKAFSKFINNNAVTEEAKKSAKSPELLARYCDIILRKGNRDEESDVEEKINQIMVVFNYVEDKDVFQKFYGRMLAKRLVGELSASDDSEGLMISKLKTACGFEYASKLQRMFQDIGVSKTLIDEYKTYCENKRLTNNVDFSVIVLTSNAWPFTASSPFNLSREVKQTFDSFKNFYSTKYTGRKLEWLYQHSKGELVTLYTKPKYTLQVSIYQITVLLLFNEFQSLTVEELLDKTQIERELLIQVIMTLLKAKILICSQINDETLGEDFKESDIQLNYKIEVDERFKSKRVRINLNQAIKSIEQKDNETVNKSIDEDRKMVIQAAAVRTMKARQTLKHSLLVEEIITQLSPRFKPQIPMIKKCIDILIEKEYLERDSKERDLFRYLA